MKWELAWNDPFTRYLEPFDTLVGDRRTWVTLTETVRDIIASGSLVCQQIAAHAPVLAAVKQGAQRVIRMVTRATTTRSPDLDAAHLSAILRQQAVAQLAAAAPDELWLLADGSDLRKPYAKAMPKLMKVRALDKKLVPGYRTLTVLGLPPSWRGILYHLCGASRKTASSANHTKCRRHSRPSVRRLMPVRCGCRCHGCSIVALMTSRSGARFGNRTSMSFAARATRTGGWSMKMHVAPGSRERLRMRAQRAWFWPQQKPNSMSERAGNDTPNVNR